MKQFYSVLFSLDNTNKEQNFVLDINEILDLQHQEKGLVNKLLDKLIIRPKQKVVDELFDMIRSGKI
jgi:predicted RNA-binding protein associated with RNAse of E/G family